MKIEQETRPGEDRANGGQDLAVSEIESDAPGEGSPAEEPVQPAGEPEAGDRLAEIQRELEEERARRQAAEDRILRLRADYENLRRRTLAEAEQTRSAITQDLLGRLLPVLDDFDRAMAAAGEGAPPGWAEGVEMVRKRLLATLEQMGLARLDVLGQEFDPTRHEAMFRVEDSGQPPNTVVEELRPGYAMGDRVLRPALVKVQA